MGDRLSTSPRDGGILTLEPLIEAVRAGVEQAGWPLSGMQKTTSHQFEGRWDGESTRSAYLFFHSENANEAASIDVYLDETSRGLTGNLALVVDLVDLGALGPPADVLEQLAELAGAHLPEEHRTPLTLRLRLADASQAPTSAESEVRFKLRIPKGAIQAGPDAITRLAAATVHAFEEILRAPGLGRLMLDE